MHLQALSVVFTFCIQLCIALYIYILNSKAFVCVCVLLKGLGLGRGGFRMWVWGFKLHNVVYELPCLRVTGLPPPCLPEAGD